MSDTPPRLRQLDGYDVRWDRYVNLHPDGGFFYSLGWRRVIERAYPHQPHYLYVEVADRVVGVLPLFFSGARPFERALVSIPLGTDGGILADSLEIAQMLHRGAMALGERLGAAYVEYKSTRPVLPGLPEKGDLYVKFLADIVEDRDEMLKKIPRKTRATFRAAERARLRGDFGKADFAAFYDLYALSLRNLGTPLFPKELFVACLEELPGACDILGIRQSGRIIGTVMSFYHGETILPFFAGTLPEARDVSVNNYLYWFILETGFARGYRQMDFGRSKLGTGSYKFKKHFGFEEIPLVYQYGLLSASEVPNVNPTNPRYQKAISAWKKLPVSVSKRLGPVLSKRLP